MKYFFYIFIFCGIQTLAQENYKLLTSFEVKADFITTDNQGNLYTVNGNELIKYDSKGKLLYKYSNKNFGNIDFVDVSNQLKILVFYKNFFQIVFLDNTLSMSGTPLSFDMLGFQQIQLSCTSHNNGIWIYDQQNFALVRLNSDNKETHRTGNINNLLNIELQPVYLIEYDNKIYMNNPQSGILIFDIYGTYYKTIPVKNLSAFQPFGDCVYYMEGDKIKSYNIKTTEQKEFVIPEKEINAFSLQLNMLFLLQKNKLFVYGEG